MRLHVLWNNRGLGRGQGGADVCALQMAGCVVVLKYMCMY